ncbi:class I SAM-dependent methyltransferase [Reyranella sp.]|uniref:class I SAM-dependent methyltransferase n=1 Tax=Reyranella sp. TaxID=1929291 RepID=UPI003BAA147A
MTLRLNIGCGRSPTPDWINYDNSLAVRLARVPVLARLLAWFGLIDPYGLEFVDFCRHHRIRSANAARRIPQAAGSVEAIYASHMLEHLDRREARSFLAECRRVLIPGGVLRVVLPDLRDAAFNYLRSGDADAFLRHLQFDLDRPRGAGRLRLLLSGGRGHRWMYDRDSLISLIEAAGFVDVQAMAEGQTLIRRPGKLDLHERGGDSLVVEARNP